MAAQAVSRETAERLAIYVHELRRWQNVRNLVGRNTLHEIWTRHVADSLQLASLLPDPAQARVIADLGTGAGLPGLILAIGEPGRHIHLVESDGRKCAFLREAARLTGTANVTIWDGRIETELLRISPAPGAVLSRALAALPRLIEMTESLLKNGCVGLFPKGRAHEAELTEARRSWRFACDILPSRTDPDGRILRIRDFEGRVTPTTQSGDDRDDG